MLSLSVKPREVGKKLGNLRAAGDIPAVVYGRGLETKPITLPKKEFFKVLKEAGESTLIELLGNKGDKKQTVLIREVQTHPATDEILHVDLYAVRMDEKIRVTVPLEYENEAPAVERGEGVLVKNIHEVEIEALPASLPHNLIIDLSILEAVNDAIRIKNIPLPAGVKILEDLEEI